MPMADALKSNWRRVKGEGFMGRMLSPSDLEHYQERRAQRLLWRNLSSGRRRLLLGRNLQCTTAWRERGWYQPVLGARFPAASLRLMRRALQCETDRFHCRIAAACHELERKRGR